MPYYNFVKEKISVSLEKNLIKTIDSIIDNKNIRNRSQALEYLVRKAFMGEIKQAVILCGGKNRKSLTKINGETLIKYTVKFLSNYGIEEILIAAGDNKNKIFKEIGNGSSFGIKIIYLKEMGNLGTAGALKLSEPYIRSSFVVLLGDEYFNFDLKKMFLFHHRHGKTATMAVTTVDTPRSKDRVSLEGDSIVSFEYPKKVGTNIINAGIYVFEREIFKYLPNNGVLERTVLPKLSKQNELYGYNFVGDWKHIN